MAVKPQRYRVIKHYQNEEHETFVCSTIELSEIMFEIYANNALLRQIANMEPIVRIMLQEYVPSHEAYATIKDRHTWRSVPA